MLLTCLIFGYVAFVSILFGFGLNSFFSDHQPIKTQAAPSFAILSVQGLVFIAIIGMGLSIVMPLGLLANGIIAAIGLFLLFYHGKKFFSFLAEKLKSIRTFHPLTWLLFGAIFVIVLAKSTQSPLNYDTGLYHAQNIRWMETYAVVPGLGNLHDRLAFNSNWLLLSALFSFSFVGLPSFHALGAFLLILTAGFCLVKIDNLIQGQASLSNFAAILVLFLLRRIFSLELSSPGTDMPATLLVWLIFLIGMEKVEEGTDTQFDAKTFMLVLLAAFAITIKVTVLPIFILPAYFVLRGIRTMKPADFLSSAGLALAILALWMARNVIISGYLVYPLVGTDWFPVDWKIPPPQTQLAAEFIHSWARIPNHNPGEVLSLPFTAWVPTWYQNLEGLDRQILIGMGAGTIALLIFVGIGLLRSKKIPGSLARYAIFYGAALIGIGAWFFQLPTFRFGYGFMGIFLCLLAAPFLRWPGSVSAGLSKTTGLLALAALLLYQLVGLYNLRGQSDLQSHLVFPSAYPEITTTQTIIGNSIVFLPAEGDQCWYNSFPCVPYIPSGIEMRGLHLEDGFKNISTR